MRQFMIKNIFHYPRDLDNLIMHPVKQPEVVYEFKVSIAANIVRSNPFLLIRVFNKHGSAKCVYLHYKYK